jgi:hypothetical protein
VAFVADQIILLDRVDDALRATAEPTAALFAKIVAGVCTRIPVLGNTDKTRRLIYLAEAGAWTDAAFTLIKLELPAWNVRRLAYENGEWLCSLSRQLNLPAEIDDAVDGLHESLPLAILRAFTEARRSTAAAQKPEPAVPQMLPATQNIMCCDNFA